MCRDPVGAETEIYPSPPHQGADSARARRFWLSSGKNLPGRAASALRFSQGLSDHRDSVRSSPAPRHLVLCTDVPVQLVGPDVRIRRGKWNGVSPAILE